MSSVMSLSYILPYKVGSVARMDWSDEGWFWRAVCMEPCVGEASCDVSMGVAGSGGREISLLVPALLVCLPLLVATLCGLGISLRIRSVLWVCCVC